MKAIYIHKTHDTISGFNYVERLCDPEFNRFKMTRFLNSQNNDSWPMLKKLMAKRFARKCMEQSIARNARKHDFIS